MLHSLDNLEGTSLWQKMWVSTLLGCFLVVAVGALHVDSADLERISRIIGGEKVTDITKWPWLVSITAAVPKTRLGSLTLTWTNYYCGASVINKWWLMTAAHCLDRTIDPSHWTAHMASIKRSANIADKIKDFFGKLFHRDDWRQTEIGVDEIIRHEHYDPDRKWINDIALFKLKKPIPVSDNVKEVLLPEKDRMFPTPGQQCVMKGWGCTEGGGSVAYYAKQVILPIVDDRSCRYMWGVDPVSRLCAGELQKQKGICPGDSGGPLVCQKGEEWVQVGIASFTSRDHPGDYYGAFTRVSHFIDWISNIIKENSGGGGGGEF